MYLIKCDLVQLAETAYHIRPQVVDVGWQKLVQKERAWGLIFLFLLHPPPPSDLTQLSSWASSKGGVGGGQQSSYCIIFAKPRTLCAIQSNLKDFIISLISPISSCLQRCVTECIYSLVSCNSAGCMLRPGLNEGELRGGMKEKTEEAELQKEEWERELENKEKAKWAKNRREREAGRN